MAAYLKRALVFFVCFSCLLLIGCTGQEQEDPKTSSKEENSSSIPESSITELTNSAEGTSQEEAGFEVYLPEMFVIPEDLLGQELQTVLDKVCPGLTDQKEMETSVSEELKVDRNYILVDKNKQQYFLPKFITEDEVVFYVKLVCSPEEPRIVTDVEFISYFESAQAKAEGLAVMEIMTNRLIETFGEPSTESTLSNRYWENDSVEDALAESFYVQDRWELSDSSSQEGFGILLKTRLAQAGKMYSVSIQYSLNYQ